MKSKIRGISLAVLMIFLILDAKTVLSGASEGLELCIKAVIPSLFPFIFLAGILNNMILGCSSVILRPISSVCGIAKGAESIFVIGILGGYPTGAQCIYKAYSSGNLSKAEAERMLGFCSNAGPAFIFGMLSTMFPSIWAPALIWTIQVVCSVAVGYLLADKSNKEIQTSAKSKCNLSNQMKESLIAISTICGWVVMIRTVLNVFNKWILWIIPSDISVLLCGIIELTNGCTQLQKISDLPTRFIVATVTTVLGGLCVYLQTNSVTGELSCKKYVKGKILQTLLSIPLSLISVHLLFPGNKIFLHIGIIALIAITGIIIFLIFFRNVLVIPKKIVYNHQKEAL